MQLSSLLGSGRLERDELELEASVRDFCRKNNLNEAWIAADRTGVLPPEVLQNARDAGLFGVLVPEAYGGVGGSHVAASIVGKELTKHCPPLANIWGPHACLCSSPIIGFGTPDQKQRFLPSLATGDSLGALAVTEVGAGSNIELIRCEARAENGRYLLNGSKFFISNGPIADTIVVLARRTEDVPLDQRMGLFIVESSRRGFSVGQRTKGKTAGDAAPTSELVFDGVEVPLENLIGGIEGKGWEQLQYVFNRGRMLLAGGCSGLAARAVEESLAYTTGRQVGHQGDLTLVDFEGVQDHLLDMAATALAMDLVALSAARRADDGGPLRALATVAKIFNSHELGNLLRQGRMVHGGVSFIRDFAIERVSREQNVTEIYEGANMVLRIKLADEVMKSLKSGGSGSFVEIEPAGAKLEAMASHLMEAYDLVLKNRLRRHQVAKMILADIAIYFNAALCTSVGPQEGVGGQLIERALSLAGRQCRLGLDRLREFDSRAADQQERLFASVLSATSTR